MRACKTVRARQARLMKLRAKMAARNRVERRKNRIHNNPGCARKPGEDSEAALAARLQAKMKKKYRKG